MNRAFLLLALGTVTVSQASAAAEPAAAVRPVVVELFTSQGCSSCPRANEILGELAERDDVIALSWSVDYWDFLGWRDTFARPEYAERQKAYCDNLQKRWRYTPQMVFDGAIDAKGGDFGAIESAIAERRALADDAPTLTAWREGDEVRVSVGDLGGASGEVWIAGFEPGQSKVAVKAGENKGRRVPHYNVVSTMTRLGEWSGTPQAFATPAPQTGAAAILIQKPGSGVVIAATVVDLDPQER